MTTSTITSKRMLVAYDPRKPDAPSSDFIAPLNDTTGPLLFGLRSKKEREQGLVVYIGKVVTVNDVFAKLVDSGRKIDNVGQTLRALEAYLRMLQDFKIGNIVGVEQCDKEACGFRLKKVADTPPVKRANFPE